MILLFDNNQHAAEKQLKEWQIIEKVNLDEWDILTIKVSQNDTKLRQKYQVDQLKTRSILIGKDGGEKWRSDRLVNFSELEALIEKMPMRQNERSLKETH